MRFAHYYSLDKVLNLTTCFGGIALLKNENGEVTLLGEKGRQADGDVKAKNHSHAVKDSIAMTS